MKIAFLFPGQGTQAPGMCKDIYDKYTQAQEVYKKASDIIGVDVAKLCFSSSAEKLNLTANTQISILITSLAICKVLENYGIKPDICTGLSLGEYTALIEGGYIGFDDGVKLVKNRGDIMQSCDFGDEYKMEAVIGLESSKIEEICKKVDGFVVPANYNYSMQTVISGYKDSVSKASELLKQAGAKRVIELNTAGPFHTEKLKDASEKLKNYIDNKEFKKGDIEVLKNIDATPYKEDDDFRSILSAHMINPVRMDKIIDKLNNENVDLYVEVGPGHTLSGFVKKQLKNANVINIDSVEAIEKLVDLVKEN